jgi:hypothetical protein
MDFCTLFFIALAGITYAQEPSPLEVHFQNTAKREVTAGEHLKFFCNINRDLLFVVTNIVEIVRTTAISGQVAILTQLAKRIEAEPAFYNVSIENQNDKTVRVVFDIIRVRDIDEGTLTCRVRPNEDNPNDPKAEDSVKIVVKRPLDVLYLKFDDLEDIFHSMVDPIEVDSGEHTVQCSAEGSNPAPASVNLYLHGDKVTNVVSKTDQMETSVVKYKTSITGTVLLTVANTMQEFECTAASQLGDSHSVKLPIKLKVYDPKISCNDSEAFKGKWYPVLTCTVDYEGLNIKNFKYELGNTKESVLEGQQNKDFVQVEREQITKTRARVLLKLYQAQDWHFKTNFYLVVEHADGHVTRESVRLREIPARGASRGPGDGSSMLAASLATVIISVWCAVKLSL